MIDWREEEWKDVVGYEGKYRVSSYGRVMSVKRDMIMRLDGHDTYYQIQLYHDGHSKSYLVHRLVAQAFLPNPDNLPNVNHIDSFKHNNVVDNLEWASVSENVNHHNATVYSSVKYHVWMQKDDRLELVHIKDVQSYKSQGWLYSNETKQSLHRDEKYRTMMSEACKGIKKCDHMRKALSASTQGRYKGWKWIYKGDVRTRVSPEEGERLVSTEGWKYGRDGHGTR